MVAESIRAYMMDPNYIKTAAPKAAKRIREAVNSHPEISQHIQFNGDGRAALAVNAFAASRKRGERHKPIAPSAKGKVPYRIKTGKRKGQIIQITPALKAVYEGR